MITVNGDTFRRCNCAICILPPFSIWSRDYKTLFKLNSAEHEILNAHKYENIKKFSLFSGSDKPVLLFFLLINVNNCWHFNLYEQEKVHIHLN